MAITKGALTVAAFKKAATWGTPVALGALNGLGFVSEDLKADVQHIEDQQIEGSVQERLADTGNRMFSGSLTTAARYEGLEYLLAQVFGTAGAPTTVDTTAKKHVFKLSNDRAGIFGTLAFDKGFEVHEFTTVKLTGFSLKVAANQRMEIVFRFAAHNLNINTSSGTNNNTTMATVTLPANREFAQFKHLTGGLLINAQSGGTLAAGDAVYINDFSLDIDRADKVDDVTTAGGDKIDEPMHDGWTVTKCSIGLSRYQDGTGGTNALFAASIASPKTPQKISATFTGDTLAGAATQKFSWIFYLNSCLLTGTPNVAGPGLMPYSYDIVPARVLTIPTGFPTGYIDSVTMEVYSQLASDPLA